jgi:hypothetical protein
MGSTLLLAACGWNPSRPFDREAPAVKEAIAELDGGDAGSAASKLQEYLSTGPCKDGSIGTPETLKQRADGTFDLGLALFRVGERFGRRFGEEEVDAGDEGTRDQRHAQVECARRVVDAIGDDIKVPHELRARAHYLDGNLAFLDGDYESAVKAYDRSLVLVPGEADASDSTGRDAAWNRAIALRRIDDKKDAGAPDASKDGGSQGDASSSGDSGGSSGPEAGSDGGGSSPDAGSNDKQDAGPQQQPEQPDAAPQGNDAGPPPPPPGRDEDERMLDQLESAPTLQQEEAKHAGKRRVRGMADK